MPKKGKKGTKTSILLKKEQDVKEAVVRKASRALHWHECENPACERKWSCSTKVCDHRPFKETAMRDGFYDEYECCSNECLDEMIGVREIVSEGKSVACV